MADPTNNSEWTQPDVILFSLTSRNRATAFEEMVDALLDKKLIPPDLRKSVLEKLEEREAKLSTAIGRGLAIPHATIHDLPNVVRLLARSEQGIDIPSPDGNPVRFLYLTLIPDHHYATHLRTIAAISSFFREEGIHEKLDAASDADELGRLFQSS